MKTFVWTGQMFQRIVGGWRTHGPASGPGPGAFNSDLGDLYPPVGSIESLKLAAWYSCLRIRAETIASFPIMLIDSRNHPVQQHDLPGLLRYNPNADMTGIEFMSATVFNMDQFGNGVSVIKRYANNSIRSLTPYSFDCVQVRYDEDKNRFVYTIDNEEYQQDEILLTKGFGTDGYFGMPALQAASQVLGGQVTGNDAAARHFKNSLRVGGFFERPEKLKNLDRTQHEDFDRRMSSYSLPENQGKYMPLPSGWKAVGGQQFRLTAADAELLESRYFGIEEMCRFLQVPPPLIGHSDKASSWASSLENLNQHFVTYSLQPTVNRIELRMEKQLLTRSERDRGLRIKFNMNALMRGDSASRIAYYAFMQNSGNITPNGVLDLEDMPLRDDPGGDEYRTLSTNDPQPDPENDQ